MLIQLALWLSHPTCICVLHHTHSLRPACSNPSLRNVELTPAVLQPFIHPCAPSQTYRLAGSCMSQSDGGSSGMGGQTWSLHSPEQIKLKRLDWSNMRVVSSVLAQSVALDFYARCTTIDPPPPSPPTLLASPLQRLSARVCIPASCSVNIFGQHHFCLHIETLPPQGCLSLFC